MQDADSERITVTKNTETAIVPVLLSRCFFDLFSFQFIAELDQEYAAEEYNKDTDAAP